MKKLTIIACCLLSFTAFAQVGINTINPDPNSMLEIASTDKGFLKPRVNLVSTSSPAPMTNHVEGMEVYNRANINDVTAGMYYNNGSRWVKSGDSEVFTTTAIVIPSDRYVTYILIDPNVTFNSFVSAKFRGPLETGPQWGNEVIIETEARNDTIFFYITNFTNSAITKQLNVLVHH